MRRLPLILMPMLFIAMVLLAQPRASQSPHGNRLKIGCSECHTATGWTLSDDHTFDHRSTTYSLTGQHHYVGCRECHPTLVFDEANRNCMECHTDIHEQTLGMYCERCHTTESWLVTNIFEIHQMSGFPLLGAHMLADCYDCHQTESLMSFEPLGIECVDCHMEDYQSASFPDHVAAGYSTECMECHLVTAYEWSATGINHDFFPLTNGHEIDDCSRCHQLGDYGAVSPECYSCHAEDYTSTFNPGHSSAGFSTDCAQCHTTRRGWKPAEFDHGFFPLEGAHKIDDCLACHVEGNYGAASPNCFSCHESDYNGTSDPNHAISGFSTDCEQCHTTTNGWTPSTFDHDPWFPIYSGKHQGEWNTCADCHTNPSNYAVFSCTDCHEHNKNETDSNHTDVNDYVYNSQACLNCHPRGDED